MKAKLLYYFKSPFQIFLLLTFFSFTHHDAVAAENNCGEIENIEFYNGNSSQIISDGGSYSIDDLPDDFYINLSYSGNVKSVRYYVKNLDTNEQYSKLENFDPYTFPGGNSPWNLGEGTFRIKVKAYKYNYGLGWACDQKTFTITLTANECTADAGSLHIDADPVILTNGSAMISASHGDAPVIPEGYSFIYVLTSGDTLVIEDVNDTPSFTVDMAGLYTIHTLVYDGNEDSANYLNLGVVDFGTTTGGDVLGIVVDNGLCAALDVAGAPVMVEAGESCDAYAGTLKSNNIISCLSGGSSTIIAYENNAPVIPEEYEQLFVLTNAFDLTILDVDSSPEFEVDHVGFYRIHSLVYNPETLDLGIVQIGQTTGFDVNGLLQQGGGDICASLDVQGAVFLVLPSWICSWFNYSYNARGGDQSSIVEGYISQFGSYKAFERSILKDSEPRLYPNPVNDILNIDIKLFDDENMSYTISDLGGRLIQSGSINQVTKLGNTIETGRLSSGTYLISFKSDYRNFVKKIQVSK